jgi:hypothetical protein
MKRLVVVPEHRLEEFQERISKINKKAEKYGCQKIQILEESELYNYTEDEVSYIVVKEFTLEIPEIKLGEYEVVGVIKHPSRGHEESEVIQFYGEEGLSKRYADIEPSRCDHCNTERYRTCQIVLRNKEGKEIVVGKSCVEEYTGIKLHADYKLFAEMDFEEEFDFLKGSFVSTYELSKVVKIAVESIKKDGYVRKSEQDLQLNIVPTFLRVLNTKFNDIKGDEELLKEYRNYIETNTFDSDFMNNLKNISRLDHIVENYFPMVACGVNIFLKNKQRVERQKNTLNSEFVGSENEKIELNNAEVVKISYFETMFGRSVRIEFNYNGNSIVWFTNVSSFEKQNLKENMRYNLKGTVKKHDTFNNIKQTILTRVKVL